MQKNDDRLVSEPDATGHWGNYGGRYVPETLVAPLDELTGEFMRARSDSSFAHEFEQLLRDFSGRPTPLFHAKRLSEHGGGAQIYLKREDLSHTGAHKINNAVGQALLARRIRRRPTRRRHGDGMRALRIKVRRLHGRGGYAPASAQRFPNAVAGRRGCESRCRNADAKGRDQRSVA